MCKALGLRLSITKKKNKDVRRKCGGRGIEGNSEASIS